MIVWEGKSQEIYSPEVFYSFFKKTVYETLEEDKVKEFFWVVGLDNKVRARFVDLVSLGGYSYAIVKPANLFRQVILKGAPRIITVHNHPSDSSEPSKEDLTLCRQISFTAFLLGVEHEDFVIITDEEHYSAKENHPEFFKRSRQADIWCVAVKELEVK